MKRHDFRPVPFLFGLVFLAVAGVWAAAVAGWIESMDLRLVGPISIIVIGSLGLIAAIGSARRS